MMQSGEFTHGVLGHAACPAMITSSSASLQSEFALELEIKVRIKSAPALCCHPVAIRSAPCRESSTGSAIIWCKQARHQTRPDASAAADASGLCWL